MQAQLDDAKVEGQHHSKKGNSLFSELEDRRLEVEKKMVTLQVQNQQLKEKYEVEKQQNQKYRMQAAMALHMTSQRHDDPHVQRLHSQLKEAHAEIRTLTEQLQKLETDKAAILDMQEFSRLLSEMEDKSYVEFLLTVIQTEKENTAKANSELQTKSLQYLDMSNQNAELIRQIKHLEAEQGKLQAALLKVQLQKEELLLKYEPEKVKTKKAQKRVVEKIDMGGIQPQLAENVPFSLSTSKLNDVLKSMSSVSMDSHLSAVLKPVNVFANASESSNNYGFGITNKMAATKQMKLRGQVFAQNNDENTFLEGKENLGNMGCGPSYGHKVSIADDVRVIESNGEEKSISLSNGVEKSHKPAANRKSHSASYHCQANLSF
ncbi:protein Spindly-A-like [Pomacea canaliculata]|uniref:protein Spindly-A-like n=1 Tax=Pomacea canaliculata TaxID=400727 RepID=UPI000D729ED9|nr:protein Spindly-A-like [Pomacea canaliculata]